MARRLPKNLNVAVKEIKKTKIGILARQRMRGDRQISAMPELEAAYLAGVIDSDGCICVHKIGDRRQLIVDVKQMDPQIVRYLGETYGATTQAVKKEGGLYYCGRLFRQRDQRYFLEKIRPYLKIKQGQAKLGLDFLDVHDEQREGWKEKCKKIGTKIARLNSGLHRERWDMTKSPNKIEDGKYTRRARFEDFKQVMDKDDRRKVLYPKKE
jgi:hypothetical protein